MLKVSLIIPVYKAQETIAACLDSVLAQTLDGLEVLLVDDHGPDDSIAVARQHVSGYAGPARFRFLETPSNGGPGVARNTGLAAATGEYVAFLDSDDTLEPDFCRALYQAAAQADADLAFGHIVFDNPDGTSTVRRNPPVTDGAFEGKAKQDYLARFTSYFTTYLYRRALLQENGIRFPGTHSAEDTCFLTCSLLSARRIAHADAALYHYCISPASVSRKKDPDRWKNRLASLRSLQAYAREKGLYDRYRGTIRLLMLKKGWLMAAKDYLTNNLF